MVLRMVTMEMWRGVANRLVANLEDRGGPCGFGLGRGLGQRQDVLDTCPPTQHLLQTF